ncbi:MAG: helix-turn-helix domain-containing protein [Oscillospiraceae bacterium]|jgi:transcriptional regulator with XRE-family HTH domain|nr:helix-turn-helix domain-containing protein [Oscillospiraceae bacterium]
MDVLNIILKLIRENYKSNAAFERELGLTPLTVSDWKRKKSESYLKMLPKLSECFNVTTDYLLGNYTADTITPATKEQVKLAIFGDSDITDEDYEEAIIQARTARQIREQRKRNKTG